LHYPDNSRPLPSCSAGPTPILLVLSTGQAYLSSGDHSPDPAGHYPGSRGLLCNERGLIVRAHTCYPSSRGMLALPELTPVIRPHYHRLSHDRW
jgi:hypothetical protein